jgi:hypothetical protein
MQFTLLEQYGSAVGPCVWQRGIEFDCLRKAFIGSIEAPVLQVE